MSKISPGLLKRSKREALLMIPPGVRETQRHTFYQRLCEPLVSSLKACHDSLYCGTETHKTIDIEAAPLTNEGILSALAFATCVRRYFTGMPFCKLSLKRSSPTIKASSETVRCLFVLLGSILLGARLSDRHSPRDMQDANQPRQMCKVGVHERHCGENYHLKTWMP